MSAAATHSARLVSPSMFEVFTVTVNRVGIFRSFYARQDAFAAQSLFMSSAFCSVQLARRPGDTNPRPIVPGALSRGDADRSHWLVTLWLVERVSVPRNALPWRSALGSEKVSDKLSMRGAATSRS